MDTRLLAEISADLAVDLQFRNKIQVPQDSALGAGSNFFFGTTRIIITPMFLSFSSVFAHISYIFLRALLHKTPRRSTRGGRPDTAVEVWA